MSKYVFINVQGVSDVSTKIFDDYEALEDFVKDFFDEDDEDGEYSAEDLLPCGKVNLFDQTLIVLEVV